MQRKHSDPRRQHRLSSFRPARAARSRPLLHRAGAVALTLVLLSQAASVLPDYSIVQSDYEAARPVLGGSDFPAFYTGARLMLSGERANSYDEETQARTILEVKDLHDPELDSGWWRYYNPPSYSLLIAPLSRLDIRDAYLVTQAVNLIALAGLLWLMGTILRWRQPMTALACLAVLASRPVLYAFWHAQPTIILAIMVGSAFLLAERGRARWAGAVLALAGIKPQWMALPLLSLLRLKPGALVSFGAVAGLMALPFAFLGIEGTLDYARLVRSRGQGDWHDDGFAEALLSWSGFFRALTGSVKPDAALMLSLLTALAFLPIWISGRIHLLPPAAVLTTLVIGPHSHPQDWLMLAPAACFMLRDQRGGQLVVSSVLLLFVLLAVNDWAGLSRAERAVYWPTLAGFGVLLWSWALAVGLRTRLIGLTRRSAPTRVPRSAQPSPSKGWQGSGTSPAA